MIPIVRWNFDEAMKEKISAELESIKIAKQPLESLQPWKDFKRAKLQFLVCIYQLSQLFIHTKDGETVGAQGTTIEPGSPLLAKLRLSVPF